MDLIPKEIISTVLCHVVCGDYEDEDSRGNNRPVDVALCNSNGYLLEIFNKKIINSCYILIEDAYEMGIYYKYTGDICRVYYLIINNNGVVIVVKKYDNALLVVKCFRNVKNFKIFDYKNKGYPQIGMYYFNSDDKVDVTELSEFDNIKLTGDGHFTCDEKGVPRVLNPEMSNIQEESEKTMEVDEILEPEANEIDEDKEEEEDDEEEEMRGDKSFIKEYLSNKLKGMENFQNELSYELDNLNVMINNGLRSEQSFPVATTSGNSVQSEKVITIRNTKTWFRIHTSKWIIGFEFWRCGIRNVNDIRVIVRNRDFSSCVYKFFDTSDAAGKTTSEAGKVTDGGGDAEDEETGAQLKSIAIFALEIPDFGLGAKLSVGFTFIHDKYQYHTETFSLAAEDLFRERHQFFRDKSEMGLSEDVLACLMICRNIDLTVEMRYGLGVSLEDVLGKNLEFKKARVLGREYYIKESGYLEGTLVSFRKVSSSSIKWKLSVAVKDLPRLKIFVKALSNELPMPLKIRIDPNASTESGA